LFGGPLNFIAIFLSFGRLLTIRKKCVSLESEETEANIYSIKCRTAGEAGGCSGLEGRRSHKAEGAIGRKSGWAHIYWEAFRTLIRAESVQISRTGKDLTIRRATDV
jgi:hypothetical protein